MLGCYRAMRALLRRLGTAPEIEQERTLRMAYRCAGGDRVALRLSRLPVPLAMPPALLRLGVSLAVRLRALCGLVAVTAGAVATESLADWFLRRKQVGLPAAPLSLPICGPISLLNRFCSARRFSISVLRWRICSSSWSRRSMSTVTPLSRAPFLNRAGSARSCLRSIMEGESYRQPD
jgi:hypothetical protein